ncbi:g12143 [Coccomyxa viridis]|uniref:G12143 protein n=1 Tax=Coccomyxa viridis TaxID=1274662 RepID=A0ABP1G9N8_9CHLO
MAKWGEKSEQWIVNDLGKDGSNVNGWHWQEQNKLPWSKQRIDELVKGLSTQLDASIGSAEVDGVKDVTGEAYLTRRKKDKVFAVYDLNIVLHWSGQWVEDDKKVAGEITIKEFSSIDPDEYLYEVSVEKEEDAPTAAANLKLAVRGLEKEILSQLQKYVQELNSL